jgi:hypothetical protein
MRSTGRTYVLFTTYLPWETLVLRRLLCVPLFVAITMSTGCVQRQRQLDHAAWVADALRRMQTIKPGMTRTDLLKVFKTEGGIPTTLHRTFVSRDWPYFKVDVEFQAVGRPNRDASGRVTMVDGSKDRIVKISRPYVQFSIVH